MKFSLFTVSAPDYTVEHCLKEMKACGYDGVEFRVAHTPDEVKSQEPHYWGYNKCTVEVHTIVEEANNLAKLCQEIGLEVCSLATYLSVGQFNEIEKVLQAATILNCPRIRIGAPNYDQTKHYSELFNQTIEDLKLLEPLAKKYKVKLDLEMHMGNIIPSASAAYRLVSHFDPTYIGVIYDVGNMVHEGYEQYGMGLEILGDYLDHVHIKNATSQIKEVLADGTVIWETIWCPLKSGQVNFQKFIDVLKAKGYEGYLSFEDFSNEQSTADKIKDNITYIKGFLS